MKTQLTLKNIFGLLAVFLILSLAACKKDSSATSLAGKWANTQFASHDVIGQYEFKSDNSVDYYSYKIDTVSKQVIGYNYHFTGTYQFSGNTLTIINKATLSLYFNCPINADCVPSPLVYYRQ